MATASVKYFSGTQELNGIRMMPRNWRIQNFPEMRAKLADSFSVWAGQNEDGELVPATRIIFFKKNPSLHKCDARCIHAKGGNCECSCGGKYHGSGG